ncbi:predicted protein [Scheffersomyces stipitis CBS 6054]|uniref:Uncharacterized protein n=1 Tax=Scheffersomyces stipitis (strain ATCC 58785 / CBS 6054 / NBRC 10063 / NRRL Y-11545) TaxID=322104 RepID=A3LSV5_PICST|nr:mitochondrial 37S ribosomal protein MRPS17 [Scheffersomyces stipitis CBS 6054]ABN65960.1 predicted protein [Scheffersomyces stipitis CBS 6054]KAG2733366.1 hypothetical protein G9P44_004356 [Scheffersomyces stipitis]
MAKQNFIGLVVSQGKMAKTVKVRVQRKVYDTRIHKEVIKRKDYLVHDEGNLCKEGDVVRIESIPKISARKAFAVAEIKVNKGQQFALYETLAKEKVIEEEKQKLEIFIKEKQQFESVVTQIEDLRRLDQIVSTYQTQPNADRSQLLSEIDRIKQKWGIQSWPSEEPILSLDINEKEKSIREVNLDLIISKIMSDEYTDDRNKILAASTSTPVGELKKHTIKNIVRKYVLNSKNELPFEV